MKAGDLVKSYLGNVALILKIYKLNTGTRDELFVDIQWCDTGLIKECYQAANFTKL
jgi:hypothetical protein